MQAVYGIIFSEDRSHVLMVKRRDLPVWVLPGGGLDPGETPEQGVCREVEEESGFEVEVVRKIAEYSPVNCLTQRTHLFECRIKGGAAQVGKETRAVEFYPIAASGKLPPPFEHWIRDALANHLSTLQKPIEGVTWMRFFRLLACHPVMVIRYLLTKIGIRFQ